MQSSTCIYEIVHKIKDQNSVIYLGCFFVCLFQKLTPINITSYEMYIGGNIEERNTAELIFRICKNINVF